MADFHNTVMGKRLIEHTFPEIARHLERIADALEADKKVKELSAFGKSLSSLVDHYPDNTELGKKIRELCS